MNIIIIIAKEPTPTATIMMMILVDIVSFFIDAVGLDVGADDPMLKPHG